MTLYGFCRLIFAFKPSVLHLRIGLQRFVLIIACTRSPASCAARGAEHYSLLSQSTKLAQATPTQRAVAKARPGAAYRADGAASFEHGPTIKKRRQDGRAHRREDA